MPPPKGWAPLPSMGGLSGGDSSITAAIQSASSMAGVPVDIATRLVKQESSFNPRAQSAAGALGLTQLMPDTAKMLGVTDPYNPADNLAGGFKYLASLKRQFGDWGTALAAYNWGPGNVEQWLKRGGNHSELPAETQAYVAAIAPKEHKRLQLLGERVSSSEPPKGWATRKAGPPPAGWNPVSSEQSAPPTGWQQRAAMSVNPMDTSGGDTQGDNAPAGNALGKPQNFSFLSQIAGHQDLPFIVWNALERDQEQGRATKTALPGADFFLDLSRLQNDPNSNVSKALALYKKNPAAAMDEYGMGSPIQSQWVEQHGSGGEQKFAHAMNSLPGAQSILTFLGEQLNPMSLAEGGIVGKALGRLGGVAHAIPGAKGLDAAQTVARGVGLGSPLYEIANRAGTGGVQWAKGLIASVKAPEHLTRKLNEQIFGGLTNGEQNEVLRLSQGLKPKPQYFKQYVDLKKRADILRNDIKHVTNEQVRAQVLDPRSRQVYNPEKYFPMSRAYDFGPQHELEEQLRGGAPGGGITASKRKSYSNFDDALKGGHLDPDFSAPVSYSTWRRQRLQRVAFEDALARAPESLRRDIRASDYENGLGQALQQPWISRAGQTPQEALEQRVGENNSKFGPGHPERMDLSDNDKYVAGYRVLQNTPSAVLKRSMIAPELMSFLKEGALSKYIARGGSQLPGEQNTWGGKFVALMRNMIVSNPVYHPAVNIAGNDAAARGMHALGGNTFEIGGYGYNAAKALALQIGLKDPHSFVGGAKDYTHWLDRALKAGGIAEFGDASKSALGGDAAKVLTEKDGPWIQRLDKFLTRQSKGNMDRTFREKGEEAFAVSLFMDAVEKGGLSDRDAGRIVREALGDYYNFDPQSPLSSVFMFMPWLKGNTKFWVNALARKPQYALAPAHAARNFNIANQAPELQSPFPGNDYMVHPKGWPNSWNPPFVGRDLQHIVNGIGGAVAGQGPGPALGEGEKMLMGRANPIVRGAANAVSTADALYSPNVEGPETNFNLMFNPKAPATEQYKQLGSYFIGHGLPVPLIGYAVQDATRRGVSPQDLAAAFATAIGLGYPGTEKLDDDGKRELKRAQQNYKRAYERYQYDDHDPNALQGAWNDYMQTLRDLRVIH